MAYPNPSVWNTGDPGAAWYADNTPGAALKVCQTDGWTFLSTLQNRIKTALTDAGNADAAGQITPNALDAASDAGWNDALQQGLIILARKDSLAADIQQALADDLASRTLSHTSLQVAISYVMGRAVNPVNVLFSPQIMMPQFGIAPSRPPSTVITSDFECTPQPGALAAVSASTMQWQTALKNPWVIAGAAGLGLVLVLAIARGR